MSLIARTPLIFDFPLQIGCLIDEIFAVQGVMNIQLFVNSRNLLIPNNNWVFASFLSILGIVLGVVLIFFVLVVLVPCIQVYMGGFLFSAYL